MKVLILILVFIGIALVEAPGLFIKKQWGEFAAFCVLLAIGFTLSLLQTIDIKVPNPNKGIEFLIKLVTGTPIK